jgi:hypothetical protein
MNEKFHRLSAAHDGQKPWNTGMPGRPNRSRSNVRVPLLPEAASIAMAPTYEG